MTDSVAGEDRTPWTWRRQGAVPVGSGAHRDLFCHMLLDTFDPYKPAVIPWPMLAPDALARLTSLPFWDIAVQTESEPSMRMQLAADNRPLVRRPAFALRRIHALLKRIFDRLAFARRTDNNSSMTMKGHESIGIDLSPAAFFDLCLAENDRRMAYYDRHLLRPRLVPCLVRTFKPVVAAIA